MIVATLVKAVPDFFPGIKSQAKSVPGGKKKAAESGAHPAKALSVPGKYQMNTR
jgi:hypothetical protein